MWLENEVAVDKLGEEVEVIGKTSLEEKAALRERDSSDNDLQSEPIFVVGALKQLEIEVKALPEEKACSKREREWQIL